MTSHSSRSTRCCAQSLPICAAGGDSEPAEQLGDIVHAFGLVSVQIDVEGELPNDARVAAAFLQIIREASTNATKHAQAHQVHVRLWQEGTGC